MAPPSLMENLHWKSTDQSRYPQQNPKRLMAYSSDYQVYLMMRAAHRKTPRHFENHLR